MKAFKVNTTINLNTGETVNSGAIVVIAGIGLDVRRKTLTTIPCTVLTKVYKNQNSFQNGKHSIQEIQDFDTRFELEFPVSEYESTGNFENKFLNLVKAKLELIYPTFVETVNI